MCENPGLAPWAEERHAFGAGRGLRSVWPDFQKRASEATHGATLFWTNILEIGIGRRQGPPIWEGRAKHGETDRTGNEVGRTLQGRQGRANAN